MPATSNKTVGRLSLYRRLLNELIAKDVSSVYSHQLAAMAQVTPAQVRRDIMAIGYTGTPAHGYDVEELIQSIRSFLDEPEGLGVALVGVGNLGRAILAYFVGRRPKLSIVAAFDADPEMTGRVIHGCRCYPMEQLEEVARKMDIRVGIIAVPASEAQAVADQLSRAGVNGILNFAPVGLHVPPSTHVENNDITMSLEIVAYYSRLNAPERKPQA